MAYKVHKPTPEAPWWSTTTTTKPPRYQRARYLTLMARDLAKGPSLMRSARRLDYCRRCIENWQHYLEHGQPPEEAHDH